MKKYWSTKHAFLNYILNVYGSFLGEKRKKLWIKDCWDVLEEEIDFLKFRMYFLHEFDTKNLNNIPSPQWLYKESRQFLKEKKTAVEITKEHIEEQKSFTSDSPPAIWFEMKKKFAKSNNEKEEIIRFINGN